jgi:hypothetical protein
MNVKEEFLNIGNFNIQDSKQIRFWWDTWLGATSLKAQHPIYIILSEKGVQQ